MAAQRSVRNATVILPYSKGYVLAGRSIREIESRIALVFEQMLAGLIVTLTIVLIVTLLLQIIKYRYNNIYEREANDLRVAKK